MNGTHLCRSTHTALLSAHRIHRPIDGRYENDDGRNGSLSRKIKKYGVGGNKHRDRGTHHQFHMASIIWSTTLSHFVNCCVESGHCANTDKRNQFFPSHFAWLFFSSSTFYRRIRSLPDAAQYVIMINFLYCSLSFLLSVSLLPPQWGGNEYEPAYDCTLQQLDALAFRCVVYAFLHFKM